MPSSTTLDLKAILNPVQAELKELSNRLSNEISPDSRSLCTILQDIFAAGGKRVRPALSFLSYGALTSNDNAENIFLVAEISELIHTASLVHDDIIDNSLIRRGQPTTNSKWDNAVTVISGDFMFARAAVNLGKIANNDITKIYAQVLEDLCDGEIWQVEKKYSSQVDWDYYFSKTYKKTASLFEASCKAAAIVAGADHGCVDAFALYGKNLGMAFQIVDDILDYQSDAQTLGKPVFADLQDGQVTMPILICLEESLKTSPADHADLSQIITDLANGPNEESLAKVAHYLDKYQAIAKSFVRAREFVDLAKQELGGIEASEFKNALFELAGFIVDRDS